MDDANVFGEESVPALPDPVVNEMTEPDESVLELYEELLHLRGEI